MLEWALWYANQGVRIFPCKPRGKTPLIRGSFKNATVDPHQIEGWWKRWPEANIAIATGRLSGLLVCDVDGAKGLETLRQLCAIHGPLPCSMVCITARGWHVYYALGINEASISCSAGNGLDIRADGGYVLAPPSIHPSGHVYSWCDDPSTLPFLTKEHDEVLNDYGYSVPR